MNRYKSRSRRGNEAEVCFTPKSASCFENEIRENTRPHPGPLPQERGEHAQRTGIFAFSGAAPLHENLGRRLRFLNTPCRCQSSKDSSARDISTHEIH